MKKTILNAVDTMRQKKIDYGDIRIVESQAEHIKVRNGIVESIVKSTEIGFGVRVLKNAGWGFASSANLTAGEINGRIKEALSIAQASASVSSHSVVLAPVRVYKAKYISPCKIDPFKVSLTDKVNLLLATDHILRQNAGVKLTSLTLVFVRNKKYFGSTEGSFIEQDIVESGGVVAAFAMKDGEVQRRSFENFHTAGYEFIESLDFKGRAEGIREEAVMLLDAPQCPSEKTTVIIGSHQMVLQVHESCGHPTELDRVFGTEASYAGTSFMTVDKLNKLRYGSEKVNIYADATVEGGLGSFGYDDEGVPAQRVPLVKNGLFVGYLSSRETASAIGCPSSGAMRADGWNRIPLIRMTNINLEPGDRDFEALLADSEGGVFMDTNKSWSIDDRRLNFQFGTEVAWRIKNGRLAELYKNATYTGITPVFWNNCDAVCNSKHWILWGVPSCGKGEPGQTAHVGHGTAPTRFRNVQIGVAQ